MNGTISEMLTLPGIIIAIMCLVFGFAADLWARFRDRTVSRLGLIAGIAGVALLVAVAVLPCPSEVREEPEDEPAIERRGESYLDRYADVLRIAGPPPSEESIPVSGYVTRTGIEVRPHWRSPAKGR